MKKLILLVIILVVIGTVGYTYYQKYQQDNEKHEVHHSSTSEITSIHNHNKEVKIKPTANDKLIKQKHTNHSHESNAHTHDIREETVCVMHDEKCTLKTQENIAKYIINNGNINVEKAQVVINSANFYEALVIQAANYGTNSSSELESKLNNRAYTSINNKALNVTIDGRGVVCTQLMCGLIASYEDKEDMSEFKKDFIDSSFGNIFIASDNNNPNSTRLLFFPGNNAAVVK